jgi:hypothetical protein
LLPERSKLRPLPAREVRVMSSANRTKSDIGTTHESTRSPGLPGPRRRPVTKRMPAKQEVDTDRTEPPHSSTDDQPI